MNTIPNKLTQLLAASAIALTLASCNNSSPGVSGFDSTIVPARVTGAQCLATVINQDGSTGATQTSTVSGADGSVFFSTSNAGSNVLIECSGGTYTDEATGATNTAVVGTLTAAVNVVNGGEYVVSPLTELAYRRAGSNPALIETVINIFNGQVARQFGLGTDTSIVETIPTDLEAANASITPDDPNDQYAIILAVISQIGLNTGNTDTALVTTFLAGTDTASIQTLIDTALTNLQDSTASAVAMAINDATDTDTIRAANTATIVVASVVLNTTPTAVTIGGTITAQATALPTAAVDTSISYTSGNLDVATVDVNTGIITGAADGTVTITATANDNASATDTITITVADPLTGAFDYTDGATTFGTSATFPITSSTLDTSGTISYTATSSPVSGISVDANSGTVSVGSAVTAAVYPITIQASSTRGGTRTADISITVDRASLSLTYNNANPVQHSRLAGNLDLGTFPLAGNLGNGTVTYQLSNNNENIGSVTSEGIFTPQGINFGTVTLVLDVAQTANYLAGSTTASLQVSDRLLQSAGSLTFTMENPSVSFDAASFTQAVNNNGAVGAVTYASSNTDIATVNADRVTFVIAGMVSITATAAGSADLAPLSVSYSLTINKGDQTITSTVATPTFSVGGMLTATASSNRASATGAVTATNSSNGSVATVSGSQINIMGGGTTTITLAKAADDRYNAATDSFTLTVLRADQNITNTTTNNIIFSVGRTLTVTAISDQASATGLVTINGSSNTDVVGATTDLTVFTILGAGATTISLVKAADDNYNRAVTNFLLTVNRADQPDFSAGADQTRTFGDADFTQEATGNLSSGPIAYNSLNTPVATVNNNGVVTIVGVGTATIVGVGTATIVAVAPEDDDYNAASDTYTLTVERAPLLELVYNNANTVQHYRLAPVNLNLGDTNIFSLTGNLGNGTVTYSIINNNSNIGSVTPAGIFTPQGGTNIGTATLVLDVEQTTNYLAGSTTATLEVTDLPTQSVDSLTFNTPTVTLAFDDGGYTQTVVSSGASGAVVGAVTYTSSNTDIATVDADDGSVTFVIAGVVSITATAAGSADLAPLSVSYLLTITKANQTILNSGFSSVTLGSVSSLTPSASSRQASATGAVTATNSSNEMVASISADGTQINILGGGTTTITLQKAADDRYNTATFDFTLTVNRANQTIDNSGSDTATVGDDPLTPTASSNRGASATGAVTATNSSNGLVASVSVDGTQIIILGGGTTTITLQKAADDRYNAATDSFTLTVLRADQPDFSAGADQTVTFGDANFTQAATGNLSLESIAYTSDTDTVATVNSSSGMVTIVGVGTASVMATVSMNNNYNEASGSYTLTVERAALPNFSINADNTAELSRTEDSFTISASAFTTIGDNVFATVNGNLGVGTVTVSLISDPNTVIASVVANNLVTLQGANTGVATLRASVAETANYLAANVTFSLEVTELRQQDPDNLVLDTTDATALATTATFTRAISSAGLLGDADNNGLVGTLTVTSSNIAAATVTDNSGDINIQAIGTTTITASFSGGIASDNGFDYAPVQKSYLLTIIRADQNIGADDAVVILGVDVPADGGTATLTSLINVISDQVQVPAVGTITATSSSDETIATISDGTQINILNAGKTTITIQKAQDDRVNAATTTFVLTITVPSPTLNTPTPTGGRVGTDGDQVSLTWSAVTDASLYTVYYQTRTMALASTNDGGIHPSNLPTGITFATTATTTFTTPTLDGNRYYFVVTATVNGFESFTSNQLDAIPFATIDNIDTNGNPEVWMSRNLGASQDCNNAISAADVANRACLGDLYQWGRAADGHQLIDRSNPGNTGIPGNCFNPNNGDSLPCNNNNVRTSNIAQDISGISNTGNLFIFETTTTLQPQDWVTGSADADGALRTAAWDDGGVNDICPAGFRLPSTTEFFTAYTGTNAGFSSALKLPIPTTRNGFNGELRITTNGSNHIDGVYWLPVAINSNNTSRAFRSTENDAGSISTERDTGLSVRCIQD